MQEFLIENGLPALFFLSFLAATILPVGSEWLLVILLLNNYGTFETVTVAGIGNYLGACTTYFIGIWGSGFVIHRLLRINGKELDKATILYRKYGYYSLFFSWVPVIGDALCLAGGIFRANFALFSMLVFSGKLARYTAIAALAVKTIQ